MSYANITFKDKNPIKRWLQRRRLVSAIKFYSRLVRSPAAICDFGAGNGELCKQLAGCYPNAKIICYEPAPRMFAEAQQNLESIASQIQFCENTESITPNSVDVMFCLEVFEHLPPQETADTLQTMYDLLKPEGVLILGVPVEVGIPALYKGIFRMSRRFGAYDATIKNVAASFFGYPPTDRPVGEIAPGFKYYFAHTGFDYRQMKKVVSDYFTLQKISASPFPLLGPYFMPEVYFIAQKAS